MVEIYHDTSGKNELVSRAGDKTELIDPYGRRIEYLRISVTDRCNLRCFYCIPEGCKDFEKRDDYLSFAEIERILTAFAQLGLKRVRFTGGEPLVRKNLPLLVKKISAIPAIEDISLSTNAILLASNAEALKEAGVKRLNVSVDSLDQGTFATVTGGGNLEQTLDGLKAVKKAGIAPIKINMLALKGINDHEIFDMVDYCALHGFTLRFIEAMPMGDTGRLAQHHYLDLGVVRERLERRYHLLPTTMPGGGPAQYVKLTGTGVKIGFITPISRHFCATCNRIRLSVDGTLYLCLGQDHAYPLRDILRSGIDEAELRQHLFEALAMKPERHEFKENPDQISRIMSATGG